MRTLYQIGIYLYVFLLRIVALFNPQAKLWVAGRNAQKKIFNTTDFSGKIAWFHAASLGEFEQGRPVIEAFKQKHRDYKILLTFFSPSGFEVRKKYEHADFIFYLPADTLSNARHFINKVNPAIVFFIKYEFWFNYLYVLRKRHIKTYIFSTIFRPEQHFFKWYGGWFRKQLKVFGHFFVQNNESATLLKSIGFDHVTLCGDTRFDRVQQIAAEKKSFPLVEQFCAGQLLFVAGSTWQPDEALIAEVFAKRSIPYKLLIAPHHVNKEHIAAIQQQFKEPSILFSEATTSNIYDANILIIDSIGILFHLYQYASFTYIGGGFGKNIHNILEAATFGNPIMFGPNYHKFQEAIDLLQRKGAYCIDTTHALDKKVQQFLSDEAFRKETEAICKAYVTENLGATTKIIQTIIL